jgi:exonuclease V
MLYKELFDGMLNPKTTQDIAPNGQSRSSVTMSFEQVFAHLGLSPDEPFSEGFVRQSQPIVLGNMLAHGAGEARCLNDMVQVWVKYVDTLGLGVAGKGHEGDGKSEDHLELVYRRAGGQKKGKGKRKRRVIVETEALPNDAPLTLSQEEERQVQLAIAQSLESITTSAPLQGTSEVRSTATEAHSLLHRPAPVAYTEEEREKEEDAIALEVELAYRKTEEIQDAGELIPIRASQDPLSPTPSNLPLAGTTTTATDMQMEIDEPQTGMIPEEIEDEDPKSGGIIGRHRFKYNAKLLANHLESVMSYWHGRRQPSGVGIEDTRRCGWCEFEEGCEWR